MKKLWVKKTMWELHLIEDEDVEKVKATMALDTQEQLDVVIDCYDISTEENIDEKTYVTRHDNNWLPTITINEEDGTHVWNNSETD
jgi:hypothetical protein